MALVSPCHKPINGVAKNWADSIDADEGTHSGGSITSRTRRQQWTLSHTGTTRQGGAQLRSWRELGHPSGNDVNVTTLSAWVNGLRVTLTVDVPSGQTDQTTTYAHGTTKGASAGDSKIAAGYLPQKETYPDSADANDVVKHAYNAQSEEIWKRDQASNVLEFDYDTRGRRTHERVTTLASGFDGAVRRIETVYDALGRRSIVTQYDDPDVGEGSIVDQVRYTYDGWGHVILFEHDRNSAVGASGSVDHYEVGYTFEKATEGRNTLRIATMTLPSGCPPPRTA